MKFHLDFPLNGRFDSPLYYEVDDLYGQDIEAVKLKGRKHFKFDGRILTQKKMTHYTGLEAKELGYAWDALKRKPRLPANKSVPDQIMRCGDSENYLIVFSAPQSIAIICDPRDLKLQSRFWVEISFPWITRKDGTTTNKVKSWGSLFQLNDYESRPPKVFKPIQTVLRLFNLRDKKWDLIYDPPKVFWFKPFKTYDLIDNVEIPFN